MTNLPAVFLSRQMSGKFHKSRMVFLMADG
jgi:hypothetical protein